MNVCSCFNNLSAFISNMFQTLEIDDALLVNVFVHFTLHPCGSKLLTSEKDGVIVVIFIICVLPLLFESPSTHILQTLRRVAQLNETRGLKAYMRRMLRSKLNSDFAIGIWWWCESISNI